MEDARLEEEEAGEGLKVEGLEEGFEVERLEAEGEEEVEDEVIEC